MIAAISKKAFVNGSGLNKNFVDPAQDFALESTCQNFN